MEKSTQSLLDACSTGDVYALHHSLDGLLREIESGPVQAQPLNISASPDQVSDLHSTSVIDLLKCAIEAEQVSVVKYFLTRNPSLSLAGRQDLVQALLDHPSAEVLQALCDHSPGPLGFASSSWDYHLHSFFTKACSLSPSKATPILHVLLDNGADIDDGWGPRGGALFAAILGNQAVEIVGKILSREEACVGVRHSTAAIQRGDAEVVEALLSSGKVSASVSVDRCIQEAKLSGNPDVMKIVGHWAKEKVKLDQGARRPWWKLK